MSISIRAKNDYSMLFSSLSTKQNVNTSLLGSSGSMSDLTTTVLGGSKSTSGINLGDYASIKNGSYRKLLKSYFNMKEEQAKVTTDGTKKTDEETELSEIEKLGTQKIGTKETDKVLTSSWEDIVAEAEAKTDALYTELGLKTGTVSAGSYLDTIV